METNKLTNMETKEKELQAIYDVIAYEERKHDIFDPKHVERIARTIQEKLAKLRSEQNQNTTADDAATFWAEYFNSTKEEALELNHMTIDCMVQFAKNQNQ